MVAFHFSIIESLIQYYANWALNNLTEETNNPPESHNEPPSKTEEMRLVCTLYHFQLHCNLFGVRNFT